ncbi:MAG: arginyltransferase [Nevskiales bacterium]|nr:arginyltransferase [Nevskiales bacterium]
MNDSQPLRLYLSAEHACGYLSDRLARSAFVDPHWNLNPTRYERLLEAGFRRSGGHAYRPHCRGCQLCVPIRIPVAEFLPNRSQRRCLRRNAGITMSIESTLSEEHFELYRRYLHSRHAGGGMDPDDRNAFHAFLECPWLPVRYWCFHEDNRLLAVAVVDHLPHSLSAVYTFFDPDVRTRGLGTLGILRQIEHARGLGLPHVYLGYWVPGSAKMDYKQQFQPSELLGISGWQHSADSLLTRAG